MRSKWTRDLFFERLVLEWRINNLIRFILIQNPIRLALGPVARTPAQQRHQFKKKRVHREWEIKKRWRRRHGKSLWRSIADAWQREQRKVTDKLFWQIAGDLAQFTKYLDKTGR